MTVICFLEERTYLYDYGFKYNKDVAYVLDEQSQTISNYYHYLIKKR